tara:strand:- start:347 stop:547 length:201 start_codon:yes stop_codon:yes gene_type:complete
MYRWLQDSIWDSVMINYDGYTQSEISYNVYKGIPYWKRIIFGFFFGRNVVDEIIDEAVSERTADLR